QLYSYLRTQERGDDPASLRATGMLLHPQTGGSVDESMIVQGHVMRVKTIDLTAPPGAFERALRNLNVACGREQGVAELTGQSKYRPPTAPGIKPEWSPTSDGALCLDRPREGAGCRVPM
ncbi:MAG: hypothetical protein JJT81_09495, partial [Rubellimicrobium sp.]|nr:hypothetical protein [Rubellimicrobium sp.]